MAFLARRLAAWRLQVTCSWKLAQIFGSLRKVGIGHFEIVSDVPFPRAAMRLRFNGIGHFEIVFDVPLPRKAEHAREAECVVVWVRPREGAQGWRGRVGERARGWRGDWRRFECTALVCVS